MNSIIKSHHVERIEVSERITEKYVYAFSCVSVCDCLNVCFCVICASPYLWLWVCLCVSVSVSLYGKDIVLSVSLLSILEKKTSSYESCIFGQRCQSKRHHKTLALSELHVQDIQVCNNYNDTQEKNTQENCSKTVKYKDFNLKLLFFLKLNNIKLIYQIFSWLLIPKQS